MDTLTLKYGAPSLALTSGDASPLQAAPAMGSPTPHPLSPDNPLLWLLGLGAVMLGLVGFSTSGHVGPLHASVSAS